MSFHTAPMDPTAESMELSSISEAIGGFRGRQEMRRARLEQLSVMVGEAKSRVARQPKAQEYLEKLQEISHQKSVGIYEELLSAVVQDVLPGPKNVALTLKTSRGLPALDIEMVKPGGERESIMDGSGGALTNILSAGLRIIALARSGSYPFLVLDEPDCWLKPSKVPQFANVIAQIAADLEIQVLLISHHDSDFFSKFSSQLRLERRGGALEAKWVGEYDPELWRDAKSGIRELRLTNYMSHAHTVIPLAPGVTCLTGENDIGKSAIVASLRSLFYGDSSDSSISHGCASFNVEAVFHDRSRLSLDRYLKKSPKQRWRYYVEGQTEPVEDSSPKDGAPDWVESIAKIAKTDDLDIAFANQKSPVFLLDEAPPKRASILAVGRESAHLQKLIAKNKERNLFDAKMMRDGEAEGALIGRELACLQGVDDLGGKAHALKSMLASCVQSLSLSERLADRLAALGRCEAIVAQSMAFMSRSALHAPSLQAVDGLRDRVSRLGAASQKSELQANAAIPQEPQLMETAFLGVSLAKMSALSAIASQRFPLAHSFHVELMELQELARDIERLRKASKVFEIPFDVGSIAAPELLAFEGLRSGLIRLRRASHACSVLPDAARGSLALPEIPKLEAMDLGKASIGMCRALDANLAKMARLEEFRLKKVAEMDAKYAALILSVDGVCPTCSGEIDEKQLKLGSNGHVRHH